MNLIALFATFIVGLFMGIGAIVVIYTKENKNITPFSIGMAFSVMLVLLGKELIHEAQHHLGVEKNFLLGGFLFLIFIFLGGYILKFLDKYIPHHHDDDCHDHHHDKKNLYHVGMMASIAIILHNVIEGMVLYGLFENSLSSGLWFSLGIILHNIPLGMVVASTIYKSTKNKKRTLIYTLLMGSTSLIGGLVMYPISSLAIGELATGIILSITVGMVFYILIFEFLNIVIDKIKEKPMLYGLLLGFAISLIGGSH